MESKRFDLQNSIKCLDVDLFLLCTYGGVAFRKSVRSSPISKKTPKFLCLEIRSMNFETAFFLLTFSSLLKFMLTDTLFKNPCSLSG